LPSAFFLALDLLAFALLRFVPATAPASRRRRGCEFGNRLKLLPDALE
jgi:hypothetical protein